MSSIQQRALVAMAAALAMAAAANAQVRPYLGYVYPAGGQQGTTFRIKLGGQNLDGVNEVIVTGKGVSGKVVAYLRKLGTQDVTLLREQLDAFKGACAKGQVGDAHGSHRNARYDGGRGRAGGEPGKGDAS